MGTPPENQQSSKRSRVVVSQSKRGCVTCKARRVKCDEQKPLCRRCLQAGRLCGGYSHDSKSSAVTVLAPALKSGVVADSHTERLSHFAAHVLSLDTDGQPLQDPVWGRIFLQLSNQAECVKAAAAAFGAAYESSLNNTLSVVKGPSSAWRYYGLALAKLQSDLNDDTAAGPESLALASMLLACVEVLNQHESNAFAHFLGTVQILTRAHQPSQGSTSADILGMIKDELVKVNLAIGSYALSQTPAVMHLNFSKAPDGDDAFREPESAIHAAMLCLHQSYQFIESASQLRYTYPSWKEHDPDMCKRQDYAVASCRSVLVGLAELATTLQTQHSPGTGTGTGAGRSMSPLQDSDTLAEIYAMRAQLTAATIALQCVHSPFQRAYDAHLDQFRTIVTDAAASARLRRRTKPSALKRFSTHPGIIGPLFIVNMKCRDPALRALAMAMLEDQGREGPTDGHIMAAIGARLVAIETAAGTPLVAGHVPEEMRVHGYGLSNPKFMGDGIRVVEVEFSRPNVPLERGWGQVDYADLRNWVLWKEPVEI